MNYYENITDLIGNTPMVKINKLNANKSVLLLVKLEKFNPSGSIKDRIVKHMIKKAEQSGELSKSKMIYIA